MDDTPLSAHAWLCRYINGASLLPIAISPEITQFLSRASTSRVARSSRDVHVLRDTKATAMETSYEAMKHECLTQGNTQVCEV